MTVFLFCCLTMGQILEWIWAGGRVFDLAEDLHKLVVTPWLTLALGMQILLPQQTFSDPTGFHHLSSVLWRPATQFSARKQSVVFLTTIKAKRGHPIVSLTAINQEHAMSWAGYPKTQDNAQAGSLQEGVSSLQCGRWPWASPWPHTYLDFLGTECFICKCANDDEVI